MKRVFLIVLDSFGIGEEPDADLFGDVGTNTIKSCATSKYFDMPNLAKMGLFNIDGVDVDFTNSDIDFFDNDKKNFFGHDSPYEGKIHGKRYHNRSLGNSRYGFAQTHAHLS